MFMRTIAALMVVGFLTTAVEAQDATGRIVGRVVREDGTGLGGVSVVLDDTVLTTFTDADGRFTFDVPPGLYSITFVLGSNVMSVPEVDVASGSIVRVDRAVPWRAGFAESVTVYAPSRRTQSIVNAPAAVSVVTDDEIGRRASHGQLPKLIEFMPGVEATQGGLYDFNLNTRGFNSSLNRRVATLIDGRDPSIPFLGAQEWAAVGFPLDDIEMVEFVRGPNAALYGANASSGVLNVATKSPRDTQGGLLRFSAGDLETANVDFRWAGELGSGWYMKTAGGTRRSRHFSVSRNGAAEYSVPCAAGASGDCLPQEATPLLTEDVEVLFASGRVDRYFGGSRMVTFEAGLTDISGPVFQTGIGRTQSTGIRRPWARVNVAFADWNVFTSYSARHAPAIASLGSGTTLALHGENLQSEAQRRWDSADGAVRATLGTAYSLVSIDSYDAEQHQQTALFEPVTTHHGAAYGQLEWAANERIRLVGAGRVDASTLTPLQFSPKASVVYELRSSDRVRFTYNVGFQTPNHAEAFLQVNAAAPADLSGLNAFCAPFGVDCGFGQTRVLAVGNRGLGVEKTRTVEVGYSGVVRGRTWLTVDYYRSASDNFISDLVPQLGSPLGRTNPDFGPWRGPDGLPQSVVNRIQQTVPTLSNNLDGSNALVVASYGTFGTVDTQGVDLGVTHVQGPWTLASSYSWFDFDIHEGIPGFERFILPNTPTHKASASASYVRPRWDAGAALRWVDSFRWSAGRFQGDVVAYATVDLAANIAVRKHVRVGVNIANVFDSRHWESFGGDLLRRRALTHVAFTW